MVKAVVVEDVWWRYEGRREPVLKGVSLEVEEGEFVAIMGPSGAGKTTLILTLNGTIPQRIPGEFRGKVEILGMETASHDVPELAKRVALVFEDPEIQFVMSTVEDELVLGLEPLGLSKEEIAERVQWALDLVGLSKDFLDRTPNQLSGGEKQRVAIATALARQPELLVLDEPTSDLDPKGKEEVVRAIRRLRDELRLTVVLVEHEAEYVAEFADRVVIIDGGRVMMEGEPEIIFRMVDQLKSRGVYPPEVVELAVKVGIDHDIRGVEDIASIISGMIVGVSDVDKSEFREEERGNVILECRDVHYTYPGGIRALRGVSLKVRGGELIALVGPNGSGKTTLAKVMAGLLKPSRGEILLQGRPLQSYRRLELSALVGYVCQNPDHQIFNQRVYDEIAFGLRLRRVPEEEVEEMVKNALRTFGLEGLEDEHPFFLSKGEKRRLALASIYVLDPRIMIVDEPTTGQDMGFSEKLMALLRKIVGEGRSVIVITHSIPLASRYADRMIVLKDGKVIADGDPRAVLQSDAASEGRLVTPQIFRLYKRLGLDSRYAPLSVEEFLCRVKLRKGLYLG